MINWGLSDQTTFCACFIAIPQCVYSTNSSSNFNTITLASGVWVSYRHHTFTDKHMNAHVTLALSHSGACLKPNE